MKLYSFYNSGPSYRVRIALKLKEVKADMHYVNLTKGEQRTPEYGDISPQKIVPTLIDHGHHLNQSLAIIEYLEETYPNPPLLPKHPLARAHVRSLSLAVAADISPLGNLKVRKYLMDEFEKTEEQAIDWIRHWIADGLNAIEKILVTSHYTGTFCMGDAPTMADCCLVPQIETARRWKMDFTPYPTIMRIVETCEKHPAFIAAHPLKQADAPHA